MEQTIRWARWLILFVIAWLVGTYIFDLLTANLRWVAAGGMALASWLVNIFARHQATRSVQGNKEMWLWLTFPPTLFLLIPLSVNLYKFWTAPVDENAPSLSTTLMVFTLRHGVPVMGLLLIYWLLGRVRSQLLAEEATDEFAPQAEGHSVEVSKDEHSEHA